MILGVSVDKETTWRGEQEGFTNVWHFDTTVDTTSQEVADQVVAKEKALFGGNVTFKRVQVWGPTDGTALQSQMLLQQPLTGTGAQTSGSTTAQETSAVINWDTGRKNTRGGRIFLRKYLHLGQLGVVDEPAAKGNTALGGGEKARIQAFGDDMKGIVGLDRAALCDKKGRKLPFNTTPVVLPHLHTRQFRR